MIFWATVVALGSFIGAAITLPFWYDAFLDWLQNEDDD